MEPLFHAIGHGVKAGRAKEVLNDVFRQRIMRVEEYYLHRKLGAFSSALSAVRQFFNITEYEANLGSEDRAWIFNEGAFALAALGRLHESIKWRESGLLARVELGDWAKAANASIELSDKLLKVGQVSRAVAIANHGVSYADQSGNGFERERSRGNLAYATLISGDIADAASVFHEAETIRELRRKDATPLFSVIGYHYGVLLLEAGSVTDALVRGQYIYSYATNRLGKGPGILDVALGLLLVGRAQDALGKPATKVSEVFAKALTAMQEASNRSYLCECLLARAAHRRGRVAAGETALLDPLRADLAETADIAEPEMRLYLTDLALERARLALDVPASVDGDARAEAARQTEIAAELIAATGYHRRDGELAELRARLAET